MAEGRLARAAPWAGLIGGALAWALQYQLLVDLLHFGCPPTAHRIGLASGAFAAALAIAAGWLSRRAARAPHDASTPARRFVAGLGVMAAAFSLAAIALQTAATLILPPCAS